MKTAGTTSSRVAFRWKGALPLIFAIMTLVTLALLAFSAPVFAVELEKPETEQANEITATSGRLNGTLNPTKAAGPGTHYFFSYRTGDNTCEGSFTTSYNEGGGTQKEHVAATVEELLPATTYTYCLVEANEKGEEARGAVREFTTSSATPTVTKEATVIAGTSTAVVKAEVGAGGLPTQYFVEFVPQSSYAADGWSQAVRTPAEGREAPELPASSTPVSVTELLQGLLPGTAYDFRFVATNSRGPAYGAPDTLTTAAPSPPGAILSDHRTYELVSTGAAGEPYFPPSPTGEGPASSGWGSRLPFRAAASGEAIAYVGEPAATGGTGETGPGEGNQWLAARTPTGWATQDITPEENSTAMFESFSSDLASSFYEGDSVPLTAEVEPGCAALYTRADADGSFHALFGAGEVPKTCGHPLFAGATNDNGQILFQSEAALTPGSEEATEGDIPPGHEGHRGGALAGEGCMFGCNLYVWSGGHLRLISMLEGAPVPSATFGGYASAPDELTNFSNAVSEDGSRIFWTDTQAMKNGEPNPDMERVYVQENGTEETQVSGRGPAEYWTATPDGRYAYYTEAGALWRFDTTNNTRERITGEEAEVKGVIGTNQTGEDGAYVYFVANAVLTADPNSQSNKAIANEANIYLLHNGVTSFIATLAPEDEHIKASAEGNHQFSNDWKANLGERLAQVTPSGNTLVFQSIKPLTGYESDFDTNSHSEVFVYSADEGTLACASCAPTGAPPTVAEGIPRSLLPVSLEAETYMRRWISEDGNRVFFDSEQPLVSQDTNGVQDVYEWERPASPTESATENSCTTQASPVTGGCTYLLSGGTGKADSFLVDADASGDNVFFEHLGPLGQVAAPADHNELYDARVDGGFAQASLACTGTGCQGVPPGPPVFATPASATFTGSGNSPPAVPAKVVGKSLTRAQKLAKALKSCAKDSSKRKRAACRARAEKRYGAKSKPKTKKTQAGDQRRTKS